MNEQNLMIANFISGIQVDDIKFIIRMTFFLCLAGLYLFGWIRWVKMNIQIGDDEQKLNDAFNGFYGTWVGIHALIVPALIIWAIVWAFT